MIAPPQVVDVEDDDPLYGSLDTPPHSQLIILIARGVGGLVAVAAIMFLTLLLVFLRATLAVLIFKWGILSTLLMAALIIATLLHYGKISPKTFSNMYTRSCH